MTKVIDVDKIMAKLDELKVWVTSNQRDEVMSTISSTPVPVPDPIPTPPSSGVKGSKTNPYKINKPTSKITHGFVPENCSGESRGPVSIPIGGKVYFEVDPGIIIGKFKINVKFDAGFGRICKLTQDKETGLYSPEACAGYSAFMEIILISNKKFLFALDNSSSPSVVNDEVWVEIPFSS